MATRGSDDPPVVDSSAALASLYQAPLAEFVSRRRALATQLKRSGHIDLATRIAGAGKPSRAAYLVNQVYWRRRAVYDGVLEAGTAARAAQQARLLGEAGDLAETMQLRDAAVRKAVQEAERLATQEGQGASAAMAAQVRGTFEALAAHGLEGRLPHGHLDADVALPGLGAFAGLTLPATPTPPTVRRFEVVARRVEAEPEPASPPDPRVVELEATVTALEQHRAVASERLDELRRTTQAAREVAAAAERAAADATRAATEARQAAVRAEKSRTLAEDDLSRLDSDLMTAQARLRELTEAADPPHPPAPPTRGGRPPTASRTSRAQ